jgi:hypothetical protein
MTTMTEAEYIEAINVAILQANDYMELNDVNEELEHDAHEFAYEERYHCGTCVVRNVLDQIWPAINDYIMFLSHAND